MKFNISNLATLSATITLVACFNGGVFGQTPPTPIRGVDGKVSAIAVAPNGDVYAGGEFYQAGSIYANHIARWRPGTRTWSKLEAATPGQGTDGVDGPVKSIVIGADGKVYVGGYFGSAGGVTTYNVAVWNGDSQNPSWSGLGSGVYNNSAPMGAVVNAVALAPDGSLHVGGTFTRAGGSFGVPATGVAVTNIAVWDFSTSQWSSYGDPGISVQKIRMIDGAEISGDGGTYYFSGGEWHSTDSTPDANNSIHGTVYDFLWNWSGPFGGKCGIYVGGYFRLTDGSPYPAGNNPNMAFLNYCSPPMVYTPISNGPIVSNTVAAMEYFGNDVIIVGSLYFPANDGITGWYATNVARFSPNAAQQWSILGPGPQNGVNGPAFSVGISPLTNGNGLIYVGGEFDKAGNGIDVRNITVWNSAANSWSALNDNPIPPTVAITAPANGATFIAPANITITVTASDSDGVVDKVELYVGATLLGTDTTAPYSFNWNNVPAGTYTLTAKATDNEGNTTTSSPVQITVGSTFIDVDFGAGTGPSTKTGFAAIGQTTNDFWNYYTRDYSGGLLTGLKSVDGNTTVIDMSVVNASGAWDNGSSDPMYNNFIYPASGNATITFSNLPAGKYDLYLYGQDSTYQVTVGGVTAGPKTSHENWPVNNPPVWQEGAQYALFSAVTVAYQGQSVTITVQPGQAGTAMISGIQIAPAFLLDVDFGAGTGPSTKTGFAAIGQNTNDFWNYYTRDYSGGVLSNLKLADGFITSIGMTVANAGGAWDNGSSDPMYNNFIYPGSGNATVTVTNLPAGTYDLYFYGIDASYQLVVGGTSYGTKTSHENWPVNNPPTWQEGVQYVLFHNVRVNGGQSMAITVYPGQNGAATISGLQISAGTRP